MSPETDDDTQVFILPDMQFEGPNLDLPSPPPNLAYDRYEDWRSEALLAINGIEATAEGLTGALTAQDSVLLAAAAHASSAFPELAPLLREVMQGGDDVAAVEAAYALVRLGFDDCVPVLQAALGRPVGAYLSPLFAAGYLAQLGDPAGFQVVREGLNSELLAVKMLACKQLGFFAPFHGAVGPGGGKIDVWATFGRALSDDDPTIQGQALVQLQWLRAPPTRPLLVGYLEHAGDELLADLARTILDTLPDD